jgi:hypothetical protein
MTLRKRFIAHKGAAYRNNCKTKLYDAIRSYGIENFDIILIAEYPNWESLSIAEIETIRLYKELGYNLYNMKDEKQPHFYIKDKDAWKNKLKEKRVGRKPALGMKHSEENKKLFSEVSNKYWNSQDTYNSNEILKYGFTKANKIFGISKTHYYRLRKKINKN